MFVAVLLVAVTAALIGSGGGMLPVAFTSEQTDRAADATVVTDTSSNAVVAVALEDTVQENGTRTLGSVTNRLGGPATITVEITDAAARDDVDFVSDTGVTVRDGGATVDVDLTAGETTTLTVDVAAGAASRVDTVDVTLTGDTDDDSLSVTLNERVGPHVTS